MSSQQSKPQGEPHAYLSQSDCRILCPTDFSPASNAAFEHAERLAVSTGASLLVLHAQPGWTATGEADDKTTQALANVQPRVSGVLVEHLVHGGPPGEVICWVAQERDCDQIVMGTHGRTGLRHLLLGSVAEYVVRHARCPVLTVRLRPETDIEGTGSRNGDAADPAAVG
ncbi:MAG: universal stress protein [Planctomycetota bacterium]